MKKNMYQFSAGQWNPFVGCENDCVYCRPSFQAQAKRQKQNCETCWKFEPHTHPDRLNAPLPRTGFMQFIFVCASGDIAFCPPGFVRRILSRIQGAPTRMFLMQSKNPKVFGDYDLPANLIIGTTLETNRMCYDEHTAKKAPLPACRAKDLAAVEHPLKMVTCEPVLDFDVDAMVQLIIPIKPVMVWIGYDTKRCGLPQPPLEKVRDLHWQLSQYHMRDDNHSAIPVILKHIPSGIAVKETT